MPDLILLTTLHDSGQCGLGILDLSLMRLWIAGGAGCAPTKDPPVGQTDDFSRRFRILHGFTIFSAAFHIISMVCPPIFLSDWLQADATGPKDAASRGLRPAREPGHLDSNWPAEKGERSAVRAVPAAPAAASATEFLVPAAWPAAGTGGSRGWKAAQAVRTASIGPDRAIPNPWVFAGTRCRSGPRIRYSAPLPPDRLSASWHRAAELPGRAGSARYPFDRD